MTPAKPGRYKFRKESLKEIRDRIGVNQRKMADLLEVPVNTLSRWERPDGPVPDANNLAAIYSVAKEYGITPSFFGAPKEAEEKTAFRYNLIVIWDFQTAGVPAQLIEHANKNFDTEFSKRFGGMTPIYKAFTHPTQLNAKITLEKLGWRVWDEGAEAFDDIIDQAKSDAGHKPEDTILVLITMDNKFAALVDELIEWGVQVYVAVPTTLGMANQLSNKVGPRFSIPWQPGVLDYSRRNDSPYANYLNSLIQPHL